jgi:ABC-type amino acid transport substrate-binding protein
MRMMASSIALLVLLPSLAASADAADLSARKTLRVLASNEENPRWFSFLSEGDPGFEREVIEGFARLHKLKLELVPIPRWDEAIPYLVKSRGDVLAGINATEGRRKVIDFSDELLPARNVVVTRRPQAVVETLDRLWSARVVVVPNTTWSEAVTAAGVPAAQVVEVKDIQQAMAALRDGSATATVLDIVDFFFERRSDPALELGMTLGKPLSSSWGVRKEDSALREALNSYLLGLHASPAWSRLIVKYFGEDALAVLGRDKAR